MIESTIYVRLLDEDVDVWRPVEADRLEQGVYRIGDQSVPDDERWEFGPGASVVVESKELDEGLTLVAVRRAK